MKNHFGFEISSALLCGLIIFSMAHASDDHTKKKTDNEPSGRAVNEEKNRSRLEPVSKEELKRLGIDPGKFGEASRDLKKVIWSKRLKKDGERYLTLKDAEKLCYSVGGELPEKEDFQRLRWYEGTDLFDIREDGVAFGARFWTSDKVPFSQTHYFFDASENIFLPGEDRYGDGHEVLCVVKPKKVKKRVIRDGQLIDS